MKNWPRPFLSLWKYITAPTSDIQRQNHRRAAARIAGFEPLEGRDLMALVLDPTFGRRGEAASGIETAVQTDGKLVQAHGRSLIRLDVNGTPDASFQQVVGLPRFPTVGSIGLQSDGKIVVASTNSVHSERHSYLTRFNSDGTVDLTFGDEGTVEFELDRPYEALLIQADDKIVVGGDLDKHGVLIRFHKNGSLDTNFGNGGTVNTSFVPSQIVQGRSGKLVAGGWFRATVNGFKIARYDLGGELDNNFGNGGVVTIPIGGNKRLNSLLVQPDGKILAIGTYGVPSSSGVGAIVIVRLHSDGQRDASFGENGIVRKNIERRQLLDSEAVLYQGEIVVVANASGGELGAVLVRFDGKTGAWDRSVGTKGYLEFNPNSQQDVDLALQPGRGLIITGNVDADNVRPQTAVRLVENTPPQISRIDITPAAVVHGQSVKLSAVATDANQTSASLTYDWVIVGPNGFRKQLQGRSVDIVLPYAGKYAVALIVTDKVNAKARAARSLEAL
jgi:uncharacterized delta-60 repeat protein